MSSIRNNPNDLDLAIGNDTEFMSVPGKLELLNKLHVEITLNGKTSLIDKYDSLAMNINQNIGKNILFLFNNKNTNKMATSKKVTAADLLGDESPAPKKKKVVEEIPAAPVKKKKTAPEPEPEPVAKKKKKAVEPEPIPVKGKKKNLAALLGDDEPVKTKSKKIATVTADGTKKVTQKEQIVALAEKGKSIDQIEELTGLKRSNISWYFSKLNLGKVKAAK